MPGSRWRSQRLWPPLSDYEAAEAVAELARTGESFAAYARRKSVDQNAVSEAVKRDAPELHARLLEEHGGTAVGNKKRGASFESSVRGTLKTRGYYAIKSYASKSPIDMLAVAAGRPNLMVQAKKGGALPFGEWNALWEIAELYGCWPVLARRPAGSDRGFEFYRLLGSKEKKGMRGEALLLPFDPREPDQTSLLAPALVASA